MSKQIQRRLEEMMSLLPCPVSGCWGLHGAETSYYHDTDSECHVLEVWPVAVEEPVGPETNGHEGAGPEILYELAEFDWHTGAFRDFHDQGEILDAQIEGERGVVMTGKD